MMQNRCRGCHSVVPDYRPGREAWFYENGKFYCSYCHSKRIMKELAPMPRILGYVIQDVEIHPDYEVLEKRVRITFERYASAYERGDSRNPAANAYMRGVWKMLYEMDD